MEEVDSIILHFLRQLNISIDDEIKNICDLPVETIVESVSRCLVTINPALKVPLKLPPGVSQRIEVAAQIASICKDLGYKNDVGYQTFLYYNETELRQVFMFLIERLPAEGRQASMKTESACKPSQLMKDISAKIAEELNCIWVPPCCDTPRLKLIGDYSNHTNVNKTSKILLTEEEMLQRLLKIDIKTSKSPIMTAPTDVSVNEHLTEALQKPNVEITQSLKELKETAIILRQKLDTLKNERNIMDVEYAKAQKSAEKVDADLKNVQNILKNIGVTDLEPSENILEKVQNNIHGLHRKSEEITSRNLSLKVEINKIKSNLSQSESERMKCKKILSTLKQQAKSLKDDYEQTEEMSKQLKKNYDKIKGGNRRSIYTKRILEIISNVDKQNLEIQKILEDTRQLQKEINSLEGQLDRCFSIADETLFKDAKKDDQAKKAYKLLALLHSECNTIVSLVNETGTLSRDIVDLEDNIKAETAKRTEDTLKRIQTDLVTIENEFN